MVVQEWAHMVKRVCSPDLSDVNRLDEKITSTATSCAHCMQIRKQACTDIPPVLTLKIDFCATFTKQTQITQHRKERENGSPQNYSNMMVQRRKKKKTQKKKGKIHHAVHSTHDMRLSGLTVAASTTGAFPSLILRRGAGASDIAGIDPDHVLTLLLRNNLYKILT